MNENFSKKSQLVVFDSTGKIISSCNTLFNVSRMTGKNIFEVFSVLNCLKEIINRQQIDGEPIFLPHIAFSSYKYRSICDFVFLKKKVKSGVLISWLINDNSLHYKNVLNRTGATGKKSFGNYFMIDAYNTSSQKQKFTR